MTLLGEIERNATATEDLGVLRFITAGSVDDGKSTLIGRLLHDTRAIFWKRSASKASPSTSRTAISPRHGASSSSPTRPATSSTPATW